MFLEIAWIVAYTGLFIGKAFFSGTDAEQLARDKEMREVEIRMNTPPANGNYLPYVSAKKYNNYFHE